MQIKRIRHHGCDCSNNNIIKYLLGNKIIYIIVYVYPVNIEYNIIK